MNSTFTEIYQRFQIACWWLFHPAMVLVFSTLVKIVHFSFEQILPMYAKRMPYSSGQFLTTPNITFL